ncbi:MAG TPA: D-alanyl-D-alanine carboxypeptidase/D-alanyl-D-alanine-endopeptidase [Acidimicrobiales bacterium]|nr:D-alanyl-D-alanine carboxypeptidase/D-alanyl-D-alanine-endopeptidase [Acidimicrobiales bacterium]
MRRRLLPIGLAAVSVAAGAFAAVDPTPAVPAASSEEFAPPLVPVLSPRRVPGAFSAAIADARLRADLDAALAGTPRSCLVVSRHGTRVHQVRADDRLVPASNLKILTGLAVLEKLGAHSRLTTDVRTAAPLRDGVLHGDLWLVGGGDPLLGTAEYAASLRNQPQLYTPLEQLADRIKAAGVTAVVGAVRGDESRYDTQRYIPTWRPTYIVDAEVGPASALTVNDGYAQWRPRHVAATAPATHAAGMLATLLQQRGVAVAGGAGEGRQPDGTRSLATLDSAPMREVVGQMLRESDNLTAELLVKELGVRFAREGSTAAGLRVLRETVAAEGLPADHVVTVDGSGLDRGDRASCTAILAALEKTGPESPIGTGMPVAARDGTLAQRFTGHPAAGRLRAKTGSLAGVTGLSGWLDSLAFAFLANDVPREAVGRTLQENVAAVLARYPDAPPPEELAPR